MELFDGGTATPTRDGHVFMRWTLQRCDQLRAAATRSGAMEGERERKGEGERAAGDGGEERAGWAGGEEGRGGERGRGGGGKCASDWMHFHLRALLGFYDVEL